MNEQLKKILQQYFVNKPVYKAYLFGSTARNEQDSKSDIDILVELDYEGGADYFVFLICSNNSINYWLKKWIWSAPMVYPVI